METINSIPIRRPPADIWFTVTPHSDTPVSFMGYTWSDMFYHNVGDTLTFAAFTNSSVIGYDIQEWIWDFGDGTFGDGQTTTKKYDALSPGLNVHLRATDKWGDHAYASMNLMLVDTDAAPTSGIVMTSGVLLTGTNLTPQRAGRSIPPAPDLLTSSTLLT